MFSLLLSFSPTIFLFHSFILLYSTIPTPFFCNHATWSLFLSRFIPFSLVSILCIRVFSCVRAARINIYMSVYSSASTVYSFVRREVWVTTLSQLFFVFFFFFNFSYFIRPRWSLPTMWGEWPNKPPFSCSAAGAAASYASALWYTQRYISIYRFVGVNVGGY